MVEIGVLLLAVVILDGMLRCFFVSCGDVEMEGLCRLCIRDARGIKECCG